MVAADLDEPRYIDAMIETTIELGLYCVIAPRIVMPHPHPESGVKKNGFSAIT